MRENGGGGFAPRKVIIKFVEGGMCPTNYAPGESRRTFSTH